jgi:hypothetical protein
VVLQRRDAGRFLDAWVDAQVERGGFGGGHGVLLCVDLVISV